MEKEEFVQYIVVRKDLVEQMGIGKTAAMVANASLGSIVEKKRDFRNWGNNVFPDGYSFIYEEKVKLIDNESIQKWFAGPFVKLVVGISSKQKLLNLVEKLDELGIKNKIIYDACRTVLEPEEENGTTLTAMGVMPMNRNNVPKCLKKLQLLD